jgi:hypothetical protein
MRDAMWDAMWDAGWHIAAKPADLRLPESLACRVPRALQACRYGARKWLELGHHGALHTVRRAMRSGHGVRDAMGQWLGMGLVRGWRNVGVAAWTNA